MPKGKVYLGDAVYAERWRYDGIKLTVSDGIDTLNTIYLELDTYNALLSFKADMDEEIAKEVENG